MYSANSPVSKSRRWWIIVLLFVAGIINYLDRAILSVALPVIAIDLKLDPTAKGVLLSAFFWSYAFMQVPSGWCADRYNLRWLYAGAFAVWSIACGLSGFATTLAMLIVLRVLLGIGESIYLPGGIKTVSVLFPPEQQGLASGFVNCGTRLGLALGAPLVAWLVVSLSWPTTFIILGFGSLLWLIPWVAVMPATLSHPPKAKETGPRQHAPLKLDRNLVGLCICQVGFGYYWYLLVTWLPDYLIVGRGIPMNKVGVFALVPYLVFAIAEPLGGWVADHLIRAGWNESRARKTIVTLAYFSSLSLIPATHVKSDWASVVLI
ncbi:MAG: MFS transporter, partial [Acidobacteria bacterium]|nr:MFS transporter [Acidobacteriota bacterium]